MLTVVFIAFSMLNTILPFLLSTALTHFFNPTAQQYALLKSFSLLLLGLFLSSLATLNFSLSIIIGLLASPLTYLQPIPSSTTSKFSMVGKAVLAVGLSAISPPVVVWVACRAWGLSVEDVLVKAAYGWDVWGMNTQVVVWCVWWPAWVMGGVLLFGMPRVERTEEEGKIKI